MYVKILMLLYCTVQQAKLWYYNIHYFNEQQYSICFCCCYIFLHEQCHREHPATPITIVETDTLRYSTFFHRPHTSQSMRQTWWQCSFLSSYMENNVLQGIGICWQPKKRLNIFTIRKIIQNFQIAAPDVGRMGIEILSFTIKVFLKNLL